VATLKQRLIERLGGVLPSIASRRASEAYAAGFSDGNDEPASSVDNRSFGYRRLSAGSVKDFGGLDYSQVLNTAWRIYLMSPIARRYLQIKRDYEIGRGVAPLATDNMLQALLDEFWTLNQMDQRLSDYVLQFHLLGEQLFPAFVRATDGQVRLGYIDPAEIERVITHPDNVLERWAVVLKEQRGDLDPWTRQERRQRVYRIVRQDSGRGPLLDARQATLEEWEAVLLKAFGLSEYTGTCMYFARNALSNQPRGYSDLLQVVDWIDQAEQTLFALAERENYSSYFVGDVTVAGGTPEEIERRATEIRQRPPRKGSFNVHNDRETWALSAPDLKQQPSIETGNMLLTFNLGGLGLPRHWYGFGDETNRATAQAQGDPTWRTMEHDQDEIKNLLLTILQFVRDQAEIAGRRLWVDTAGIDVQMPEMTARDLAITATAAGALATALIAAQEQGWITRVTAAETWARMQAELGVEVNAEQELAATEAERERHDLQQQQQRNIQWTQMLSAAQRPLAEFGQTG